MKLKTLYTGLTVLFMMMIASPALATMHPTITAENTEARVQQLQHRLEEIKGLDASALTRTQKKTLRREVRQIKKELAAISGGVYLSVGAIILIALLLILLL